MNQPEWASSQIFAAATPHVSDDAAANDPLSLLSRLCSPNAYSEALLEAAMETVGAAAGSTMLVLPGEDQLCVVAARGPRGRRLLGTTLPFGTPIAGEVAASQCARFVADVSTAPDMLADKCQGRRARRYAGRSFISAPLVWDGDLVGVLNVSSSAAAPFTKEQAVRLADAAPGLAQCLRQFASPTGNMPDAQDADQLETLLRHAGGTESGGARQILRLVDQAVLCFDDHGHIVWSNPAAEVLFGAARPGRGATLWTLPVSMPAAEWMDFIDRGLANGAFAPLPKITIAPGGDTAPRIVTCQGLVTRRPDGSFAGGCLTFRDLTHTVRLEAQASATDSRSAMGELLAEVAHELNNPLDSTRRLLKLAQHSDVDSGARTDYLQDAQAAMDRMVGIVSKVLTFARQEHGMAGEPQPLTQVLDTYFHEFSATERYPNVRIVRDYLGLGPIIPRTDFTAIIDNLVRNACDAMDGKGTIVLFGETRPTEYVLEVQDTGPGMSPVVQQHIFDPFFTTKGYGRGTGLGLALCRKMLEPHGGTLRCTSEEGVGTTFRIVLPLAQPDETPTAC